MQFLRAVHVLVTFPTFPPRACTWTDVSFPRASHTNVRALNGGLGCPETETDVLVPSPAALANSLALAAGLLVVEEDVRLLLESTLALDS